MDTAKVKNFILVLLLVVNLFLLTIVIADSSAAARTAAAAEAHVTEVLAQNGITVGRDVDLDAAAPGAVVLRRDLDAEQSAVAHLIGRVTTEDLGGNIIYYGGEKGQAKFRGTGEFDISLNHGAVETGTDPVQTAKNVLSKLGMDAADTLAPVDLNSGDFFTITLTCAWQGGAIFNGQVTFTFAADSLLLISGRRAMDTVSSRSEEETLDAPTVLMRFLDLIRSEGHVCTELRSMTPGYAMSVSVSGDGTLYPVWRIETDSGEYYINGLTGRAEPIAY
jgi:hypothetical protein